MKFTKEELSFLDMYSLCNENKKDNRKDIYGKVRFRTIKDQNKVEFSQFSSDTSLGTEFTKDVIGEDFELVMPTQKICNLIKMFPKNAEIEFTKDGISYNGNKYSFTEEVEKMTFPSISPYIEEYVNSNDAITITNLSKLSQSKQYMGGEDLDAIMVVEGYFVSTNLEFLVSAIKTDNDKSIEHFISKNLISFILAGKLNSVELVKIDSDGEKYSSCKIGDTYIFSVEKEYQISNIFDPEMKEAYDFDNHITVDKSSFMESLSRIKLFANPDLDNRVKVTCKEGNKLSLSIAETGSTAMELVDAEIPSSVIGREFYIASLYVLQTCNDSESEELIFSIGEEEDNVIYVLKDDCAYNFYVHKILPN